MSTSPTPRPGPRASRLGLVAAVLAAAGTFAVAVALAIPPVVPAVDAVVATAMTRQVVESPTTGERVVIDTVYVVTPEPVATPAAAALAPPTAHGDEGERDGEEGEEHDGGDD